MQRNQIVLSSLFCIVFAVSSTCNCDAQGALEQWKGQRTIGQWIRPVFDRSVFDRSDRDQDDDPLTLESQLNPPISEMESGADRRDQSVLSQPSIPFPSELTSGGLDPIVVRNRHPADLTIQHVLETGLDFSFQVVQKEATKMTDDLDHIALSHINQNAVSPTERSFEFRYRELLSRARPQGARFSLFVSHLGVFRGSQLRQSISTLLKLADAADGIASLERGDPHRHVLLKMDRFGSLLSSYRRAANSAALVPQVDVAAMQERIKGIRNLAVLMELARLMSDQGDPGIVMELHHAWEKAQAPSELLSRLIGMVPIPSSSIVPAKNLPAGYPSIIIYNPSTNRLPIRFLCNDSLEIVLDPGELVPFNRDLVVSIRYGDESPIEYPITPGVYCWIQQQPAWRLQKESAQTLTIDATFSPVGFHFLVNGEPQVIDPGSSQVHQLSGPARIDFEMGLGDDSVASMLVAPGTYYVGIDVKSSSWSLFRQTEGTVNESANWANQTAAEKARYYLKQSVREVEQSSARNVIHSDVDWLSETIQ